MTTRSRIAYLTACSVAALGLATAAPVFAADTAGAPAPTAPATAQHAQTAKHAPAHKAKAQHKAKKAHTSAKKHTLPKTGA